MCLADISSKVSTWLKVIRHFGSSLVASIKLYPLYSGRYNTEKLSFRHLRGDPLCLGADRLPLYALLVRRGDDGASQVTMRRQTPPRADQVDPVQRHRRC